MTEDDEVKGIEGRAGRLGEMPQKRKRDDGESVADTSMDASTTKEVDSDAVDEDDDDDVTEEDDEFEGFDSDSDSDDEAIVEAKKTAKDAAALGKEDT